MPADLLIDEIALTQGGLLGADDADDLGAHRHLLAGLEVPVIGLVAVGGHDTDIPGIVEQLHRPAQRIIVGPGASQRPSWSRPGSSPAVPRCRDGPAARGRGCVDVDRVLVTDRVDPVVNHGLIHRVPSHRRLARPGRDDLVDPRLKIRAHLSPSLYRVTRGTRRPDAAIISRITSLTPPPKVITRLRLVILSSQTSSSAVSESAGLP